jgi:tetratricopeptide (TPR) repeat protein
MALLFPANSWGSDDEARKHILRGTAAIEAARSIDELSVAVEEFKKATELAPDMAAAWYNLGSVQAKTGELKDAIASYQRYVTLAPQAADAQKVKDEIVKLEFRLELAEKVKSRAGTWITEDGTPFRLSLDGNRMTLVNPGYPVGKDEVDSAYTLVGNVPVSASVTMKYVLSLQGRKITGVWSRTGFSADKCPIPEDGGEVTGELNDADHAMTLKYTRTKYRASTQLSILTDDYCREVVAVDKSEVEKKLFGPLPNGGIGASLGGIHAYWPGGFSAVVFGWSGHLVVYGLQEGSPAYKAGLRNEDEILTINDKPVAKLSVVEALQTLRGEPGSQVALTVIRDKNAEAPIRVRVYRVRIPDDQISVN